jgi:TolA-binding protein
MNAPRLQALAAVALLVGATAPGCATKHDVRDLEEQILALRAHQDSVARLTQRQNRELLDSLRATTDLLVRVRGDLGHQLINLEQQLVQVQELTGQGQRRLQELNQQLEQNRAALGSAPATADTAGGALAPTPAGPAPGGSGGPTSAAELYALAQTQRQNGAASTARMAFQQLIRSFPGDTLAPAAQLGIAETYVSEDPTRALREFDRVVELYPSSPRAPAALLEAAEVLRDRGNVTRAREYLRRILARYPRSPEAAQARRRLSQLGAASTTAPKRTTRARRRTTSTRR